MRYDTKPLLTICNRADVQTRWVVDKISIQDNLIWFKVDVYRIRFGRAKCPIAIYALNKVYSVCQILVICHTSLDIVAEAYPLRFIRSHSRADGVLCVGFCRSALGVGAASPRSVPFGSALVGNLCGYHGLQTRCSDWEPV